ncbi:HlyD family efflux transporter periplasmic adaptor subunit [Mesorhizobium sp. KR2-14]|uniref:HlyD family secretion protein n=1 Tax=Mesorhizobium sp. KR2-14 TaxID=3156610 RepID=UPI0032B5D3F2
MHQEDKATGQNKPAAPETEEFKTSETHEPTPSALPAPPASRPPATIQKARPRRRWRRILLILAILAGGAGGGFYWWQHSQSQLPAGIAWGNGRIEADEIDIDTKFAGRIAEMLADEGDMVKAGQVVARMDTQDLKASLKRSQALVQQAQRAIDEANANVVQQTTQVRLAEQELDRTAPLVRKGFATNELLDQRRQQLDGAKAALTAAQSRVIQAQRALDAATHEVELYTVNIADNTLVAPRDGRIQYRVANIGEVLPAGGKVFTMLDISYVYMDIYLPTAEAGRAKVGDDSRIVLDAYPTIAIPAKVSFVATQAQFTPKTVETRSERDKLMFRVRVKIDPDLLRAHAEQVRSGLPGLAYVKLDPQLAWPPQLQGNVPK